MWSTHYISEYKKRDSRLVIFFVVVVFHLFVFSFYSHPSCNLYVTHVFITASGELSLSNLKLMVIGP